jgi:hypothetical protein
MEEGFRQMQNEKCKMKNEKWVLRRALWNAGWVVEAGANGEAT